MTSPTEYWGSVYEGRERGIKMAYNILKDFQEMENFMCFGDLNGQTKNFISLYCNEDNFCLVAKQYILFLFKTIKLIYKSIERCLKDSIR